ncbi:MAG: DUF3995 domain-containing protein [Saprospiraceae bacterium]
MALTVIYLMDTRPFQFTTFFLFLRLLVIIIFLIALLHFYWAAGGKKGLLKSIPSKEDGTPLFLPNAFQCTIVGIGLMLILVVIGLWLNKSIFSDQVFKYGFIILGGIFTLRAIGDFNYVGFFKKIKDTSFGKLDSKFYSPLCLLIGGIFFWMAITVQI